uniref:Uncharacterized protein n=1 Tax=Megaselia scalaris TaxID=36166 RepID=T1GU29_MEGSC
MVCIIPAGQHVFGFFSINIQSPRLGFIFLKGNLDVCCCPTNQINIVAITNYDEGTATTSLRVHLKKT